MYFCFFFFFQAEDGIRDADVTGVQTCALPILRLLGADQRALFEETEKEAPGFAFVVRSMQIEFLKAARMDDVLEVITTTHEVRGASITLDQRITRGEEVLIEARVQVAFVSGGRARRIPDALRAAMRADQKPAAAS